MIRSANPAIDVANLETRVRSAAASAPPAQRSRSMDDAALAQRLRHIREVLADIDVRLVTAAERSAPRLAVPPRLIKFGPIGPLMMRALNYAFKSQRESDAEQRAAIRGAASALAALADIVALRQ
jgi:hypothetical protein